MTRKNKVKGPHGARSLSVTLAIAFFTLSVVMLLVYSIFALFTNIRTYQESISVQQLLIAKEASKAVSNFVEDKIGSLEATVELVDLDTASADQKKTALDSLLGLQPAFRQLALLNKMGRGLAWTSRISPALTKQFTTQYQTETLIFTQTENGQRYISSVYIDEVTSEPLILLSIPVTNVFGDFQSTLVAELNLKFMWDLVDQLKVGETGYAYVVDNQGNLIAFRDTSRVLRGENVKQVNEVQKFIENPLVSSDRTQETVPYTGLTGKTVVGSYVSLGTPQWAVLTELPTTEAYNPIFQVIVVSIGGILGMAILAGLSGTFIARRLAAPLIDLSNVATEVGSGNLALLAKVAGPAEAANLAATFNSMTSRLRDLIGTLEQRVADRTKALATSAEVSRRLSTILNRRELVIEVVEQIKEAFGYYHVHIYLFDNKKEYLIMVGGTGDAGTAMLVKGHKVPKGRGLVGRAADSNKAVLVPDTTQDPDWLPNPLLPETRSEAVIPISIGDLVLGVLDVQQDVTDDLGQDDVDSLQTIANQVAVAMQNIESAEKVSKRASELQTVSAISTATATIQNEDEMLATVVHLTQRQFDLYHAHIFSYDENTQELEIVACGWEEGDPNEGLIHGDSLNISLDQEQSLVARAARTRQAITANDVLKEPGWLPNPQLPRSRAELAVPLIVGDKLLGVLDVQSDRVDAFSDEDANIHLTLASQIAVAIQNARSFTEAQRHAQREKALRQITNSVRSSTTLTTILRTTVRELGTLMGRRAIIRMATVDQSNGNTKILVENASSENANGGTS